MKILPVNEGRIAFTGRGVTVEVLPKMEEVLQWKSYW